MGVGGGGGGGGGGPPFSSSPPLHTMCTLPLLCKHDENKKIYLL